MSNEQKDMNQYMITIDLPRNPTSEYISLIVPQRDMINDLMNKGFISDVSLSEDRTKLWLIVNSESENEIKTILQTFPLVKYMKYRIDKLLFKFTYTGTFPQMSMN